MVFLKWVVWMILSCACVAVAAVVAAGMIEDYHKKKGEHDHEKD